LAHRAGKPVVVYWTTGIITKTAFANYSGKRLKDQLARSMARIHNLYARGLARRAALNIIINQDEYGLLGKPANTHWAIPMRITDTDIKPPLRRMFQEFQVVYAGRLSQHKGVFDLLDAVALLAPEYPHLRLVLAGDGPVREGLSEKIKQYQLEDKVSLPGQMDKDNLFSLMSRSHVMALPSFNEGSPRVLWEAWAAGIPVIMTPVGAVDKHVTHNLNGLLVPPGYPQELAAAIKTLMDDETMRYQMALAGNETVVRYSWEAQIAEMAEALKRLMHDHRVTKP
jgi:glycosyltransferase involved in cell wall biosynthesis